MENKKSIWPFKYKALIFNFETKIIYQNEDIKNIKTNLRDLDEKIILSKAELNRISQENLKMETELKSYGDKVPVIELENRIKSIQDEIKDFQMRIDNFKSKNTKIITKEEKYKVKFLN